MTAFAGRRDGAVDLSPSIGSWRRRVPARARWTNSIRNDEDPNALYAKQGNFRRAYAYQRAYSEIKEQIFSKENFEKIATLQAAYQADKQDREIELLK